MENLKTKNHHPSLPAQERRGLNREEPATFIGIGPSKFDTLTAVAASGDGILVGSLFGIASGDAAIGDKLVLTTKGVFTMPKASTGVMAVGAVLFWDASAGLVTTDDDTGFNPRIGLAVTTAGNPNGSVNVRLDG